MIIQILFVIICFSSATKLLTGSLCYYYDMVTFGVKWGVMNLNVPLYYREALKPTEYGLFVMHYITCLPCLQTS